jgi:thiamine-phosphate pyrophosphorylase
MAFRLPPIYPITDRQISGLSHAAQVERMAEGGATVVQLREKVLCARDFFVEARGALEVARQHGVKLIINDRADIAHAVRADGVHLGQEDMPAWAARELLGPRAIIGVSTHNLEQLKQARNEPLDYIAVGPIFSTTSKNNPDPVVGLEGLQMARQEFPDKPLVAIGGITLASAADVLRAGADSVALIRALLDDPNKITDRFRALLSH